MVEYLIGYGPLADQGAAQFVVEERDWPDRAAMQAAMEAEGWECVAVEQHRPGVQRFIFQRSVAQHADAPRHLLPCW